jgi:hypothetical protein
LCDNDNRFCFRLILQLLGLNGAFSSLQPIVQSMQIHCAALYKVRKFIYGVFFKFSAGVVGERLRYARLSLVLL